jgi:hypothetical protein
MWLRSCGRIDIGLLRSGSLQNPSLYHRAGGETSPPFRVLIILSSDLVRLIDDAVGSSASRSAFIERVLRRYFRERTRKLINARDARRIDAADDELNAEVSEVLKYQALND